jgi:hypothetical protein
VDAGVTVRCIGSVQFVAIPNPSKALIGANGVLDRERKVSGYPEDVFEPDVMQAGEDVLYYGGGQV